MPRLNIYLPEPVYDLASRWRDSSNLSEICARAIKDELDAVEGHRSADSLLQSLRPPSEIEDALAKAYGLVEVVVAGEERKPEKIRDALGKAAAAFLDRNVSDGSMIALAGGRQMWCLVRNLAPRRVRTKITALGMHHADPVLLHAHPNTLATLVWLLYSPRSEAYVIGASSTSQHWTVDLPSKADPSYFVISSCSSFDENSSFAELLGDDVRADLNKAEVLGDFAYVFFDKTGKEVEVPLSAPHMKLSADLLSRLSKRSDARTVLVAGGEKKLEAMRVTLQKGLCNTLITDRESATRLLE